MSSIAINNAEEKVCGGCAAEVHAHVTDVGDEKCWYCNARGCDATTADGEPYHKSCDDPEDVCDCCGAHPDDGCDDDCDCTDCQREHDTEEEED
jgi:hypothetical protein